MRWSTGKWYFRRCRRQISGTFVPEICRWRHQKCHFQWMIFIEVHLKWHPHTNALLDFIEEMEWFYDFYILSLLVFYFSFIAGSDPGVGEVGWCLPQNRSKMKYNNSWFNNISFTSLEMILFAFCFRFSHCARTFLQCHRQTRLSRLFSLSRLFLFRKLPQRRQGRWRAKI